MRQVFRLVTWAGLGSVLLCGSISLAQSPTLASTIEVYVFPAKGQDASQQSQDETACYGWAVSNTGSDPFELQKQQQADEQAAQQQMQAAKQTGKGAGARGAVGGAAAGALVGEIAGNDVGHSAAVGAAIGAVGARRRGAAAQQQAVQQTAQQSEGKEEATAEQIDNFKKAFSVCLEGKEYMVKY
jgi:hypothetical protein